MTALAELVLAARAEVEAGAKLAGLPQGPLSLEGDGCGVRAYSDAIASYLALGVSKSTDYNSVLVQWSTSRDQAKTTFTRQALPMIWDYAEVNPFAEAAGDLSVTVEGIGRVLANLPEGPIGRAFAHCATQKITARPLTTSTDPPYFDNISYAELSDYFYNWMRRCLRPVMPDVFATVLTPKEAELVATPHRHGGQEEANRFFLTGMGTALRTVAQCVTTSVPITIYYAFKQSEAFDDGVSSTGWETFLTAVLDGNCHIDGTWPIRTERGARSISLDRNALASSIVLVCRVKGGEARTVTRSDFRRLLRQELPKALKALQKGNIAPVDMAQASIGPGMAIFSRHAKVIEADGSAMSVRTSLQLINEALDEYLAEQTGEFGPETRFAVTWFESHGFDTGKYGDAETLAKARNVSVQGVVESGILHSAAGKVRLLKRSELPNNWEPETDDRLTVWECTQHLIKRLEDKGETVAADLLSRLGERADPARDLAYRLYQTCERKGWAEEARAYNGLVVAWPELAKLAAQQKGSESGQQEMFS